MFALTLSNHYWSLEITFDEWLAKELPDTTTTSESKLLRSAWKASSLSSSEELARLVEQNKALLSELDKLSSFIDNASATLLHITEDMIQSGYDAFIAQGKKRDGIIAAYQSMVVQALTSNDTVSSGLLGRISELEFALSDANAKLELRKSEIKQRDDYAESLRADVFTVEQERDSNSDMLDSARIELELLREAMEVPVEPHQSLSDRMVEAAKELSKLRRYAVTEGPSVSEPQNSPIDVGGLSNVLRMYAEDIHSLAGHSKCASTMSKTADAVDRLAALVEMATRIEMHRDLIEMLMD